MLRICGGLSRHLFVDNRVWDVCVSRACSVFFRQLHSNEFARVILNHSLKHSLIRIEYNKNLN